MQHVQVSATDSFKHNTSRKPRGTFVQIGIILTDCNDIQGTCGVCNFALAQKTDLSSCFEKIIQSLQF